MEVCADLGDWEILFGPEVGEDLKPSIEAPLDVSEKVAFKSDYFSLDPRKRCHEVAAVGGDIPEDALVEGLGEAEVGSGNLSWIDPESPYRFVDRPKTEHGFQGIGLSRDDLVRVGSDESSDGQRSRPGSKMGELGDTGGSEIGEIKEGCEEAEAEVGLQKTDKDVHGECVKIEEFSSSTVEIGGKSIDPRNSLTRGGEKTVMVWWKLPFEILKFCACRVKPVWSISIAAAILGVLMLRKRLYNMKHRTTSIPLKFSMDQQETSQLKIRAARLNDAFSVVRRVPLIRASLPSSGLNSWFVEGLLR